MAMGRSSKSWAHELVMYWPVAKDISIFSSGSLVDQASCTL